MNETRTFEIRLPGGRDISDDDLNTLRTACEALAELSCSQRNVPPSQIRALTDQGWRVHSSLVWVARAERDRESEEAVGTTRDEALCRLCQLIGLHSIEGCP
jgi:hypothetical protein